MIHINLAKPKPTILINTYMEYISSGVFKEIEIESRVMPDPILSRLDRIIELLKDKP